MARFSKGVFGKWVMLRRGGFGAVWQRRLFHNNLRGLPVATTLLYVLITKLDRVWCCPMLYLSHKYLNQC